MVVVRGKVRSGERARHLRVHVNTDKQTTLRLHVVRRDLSPSAPRALTATRSTTIFLRRTACSSLASPNSFSRIAY